AAAAAAAAANPSPPSTADGQPTPSPAGTPSGKWRQAKAVGLSKSAVIRMEMLAGRPGGASLTSIGTASTSPPVTPGGGAAADAAAPTRTESLTRTRGQRSDRSPDDSPRRSSRTIGFVDGGGGGGGDGASPASPRRRFGAASHRASLRSQSSFASSFRARGSSPLSTRAMLAESSAFSFAVRGVDGPQTSPKTPAAAAAKKKKKHQQQEQRRVDRSSGTALSDVSDPDGAPHSPRGGGGGGGAAGGAAGSPSPTAGGGGVGGRVQALVNNFLYMTPPGFLSAGKVLNPANFPWPREVPSQDTVQMKADFILRATLPNLNAMPQLPDIVFGPLGDPPGSQEPSPEPSLMSHASNSSRAITLVEAVAAAAAAA
ncbi:hypothetical protein PLESTF_000412500, partial [Pleodorina starrii]